MTLTLYGAARSRASIVRWYMEEKGIPYATVLLDLRNGEQRHEPFTTINPFGKVPALIDDALSGPDGEALKLFESGAILLYLAEHYGGEFQSDGPADDEAAAARRALTGQWILFANASFGPAMLQFASRPEELQRLLTNLDGVLARGEHLLAGSWGDPGWGAADCAVQAYLAYLPMFCADLDLSPYPRVQALIAATTARPSYARVMGAA